MNNAKKEITFAGMNFAQIWNIIEAVAGPDIFTKSEVLIKKERCNDNVTMKTSSASDIAENYEWTIAYKLVITIPVHSTNVCTLMIYDDMNIVYLNGDGTYRCWAAPLKVYELALQYMKFKYV